MRAVVDANVLISAVLSSRGPSSELVRVARDGGFELILSELLLTELERAFGYPKLRKRISAEKAAACIGWLRSHATLAEDPAGSPPVSSPDPDDDYLLALAIDRKAFLVTGDQHLLGLRDELPIYPSAEFLRVLTQGA
ncbi:MAG TPA: putative toxin-antitoxin system toxin component, PIN family [Solirubrobacteraceae bacterium]|nr:putative toxin-antitoxin system toxin component, PIN family [Solirubrobacteraceae bacterium]